MRTREVVAVFFRDFRLVSAAFLIPLILALLLWSVLPRSYEASAKIVVNVSAPTNRALAEGDGGGPQSTALEVVNSEVEVLTSQDLARRTLQTLADPRPVSGAPVPAVSDAALARFAKALTVRAVPASHVISVRYDAVSQRVAAETLKVFLSLYTRLREQEVNGPVETLVRTQISGLEGDVEATEAQISGLQKTAGLFDPEEEKKNLLATRSTLSASALQLRAQAAELSAKVASVGATRKATPSALPIYPTVEESDAMARARAQLLELRQQQAKLAPNYQPDSRTMRDLQGQIEGVEAFLAQETQRFQQHPRLTRNPLFDQLTAEAAQDAVQISPDERQAEVLNQEIAGIDARLQAISDAENRLAPLKRREASDVAALEALRQREAATLVGSADASKAQGSIGLIETPEVATDARPVSPKLALFALAGLVGGGALAAGVLGAAYARKNTFLMPEAVEGFTSVPVLVSLPAA